MVIRFCNARDRGAESSARIATNFLAESFLLPTKILSRSRASNKNHRDAYILVAERSTLLESAEECLFLSSRKAILVGTRGFAKADSLLSLGFALVLFICCTMASAQTGHPTERDLLAGETSVESS